MGDKIIGDSGDNYLLGGEGDDTLNGGAGADTMAGAAGNDLYFVDNQGDVIVENLDEGRDTVRSSVDWALGENLEDLVLLGGAVAGFGNALDNRITGNGNDNELSGGEGNDTLNGGGGSDLLSGGGGDDLYVVDTEYRGYRRGIRAGPRHRQELGRLDAPRELRRSGAAGQRGLRARQ